MAGLDSINTRFNEKLSIISLTIISHKKNTKLNEFTPGYRLDKYLMNKVF